MADNDAGTTAEGAEAQTDAAATAQSGTQHSPDEVTTLRSRNAGLDAKVTELTKAQKAAEDRAAAAAKKLADYEAELVSKDEALRAQLAAKDAELTATRQEAALARIQAQYPETFAVLGDAAASLSADKLAEAEARFKGVAAPEAPATSSRPLGNNQARGGSGTSDVTSADIAAKLATMEFPH